MWLLAARILSYDYLWSEVRVKGGAYGAGFQTTRAGVCRFYSYRDPRIDETCARFGEAGSWLAGVFDPAETEMDGYVVSAAASMDAPAKARELIRRQDGMYFAGYDLAAALGCATRWRQPRWTRCAPWGLRSMPWPVPAAPACSATAR